MLMMVLMIIITANNFESRNKIFIHSFIHVMMMMCNAFASFSMVLIVVVVVVILLVHI